MSTLGFMMVTSWWRRSGWESNSSGASFFITASSCSAAEAGTPYHVLGSPLRGGGREREREGGERERGEERGDELVMRSMEMDGESMRERRKDEDGDQHSNYNVVQFGAFKGKTVPHSLIKPRRQNCDKSIRDCMLKP